MAIRVRAGIMGRYVYIMRLCYEINQNKTYVALEVKQYKGRSLGEYLREVVAISESENEEAILVIDV